MSTEWLSLIEYRNKYDVSVSTLRRRIRDKAIKFQQIKGKYFIFDEPIEVEKPVGKAKYFSPQFDENFVEPKEADQSDFDKASSREREHGQQEQQPTLQSEQDSVQAIQNFSSQTSLDNSKEILSELKLAYQKILKEKEEQIFLLREEMTNLQMLVRVLEDENQRLRN